MRQDYSLVSQNLPAEDREIELKFLTSESGFKSIQSWPMLHEKGQSQRLVTRYFDTEEADLERRKMVLRVRRQGRANILTLKWSGSLPGLFERGEVEARSPAPEPDPALLGPEYAALLADILQGRPLIPIYETHIRRITHRIRQGASDIEIAFDTGFVQAAEKRAPIREIEMELKSGDPAELYRLGMTLAETYPVRLGPLAKSQQGAALRSGAKPPVIKSVSPLQGALTVDDAIAAMILACTGQFIGNFAAFEAGDPITAIHQMRVAMRRLRSNLKLFERAFPCGEFTAFRLQAKSIADQLGQARNWDVFRTLLREGPAAAFPEQSGFDGIFTIVETHRATAHAGVTQLLAAPETTRFVLALQAFVARRGWRNAASAEALARLTQPAKAFAQTELARMHARLVKQGKNLAQLSPHARHELRIGLKKLRYAADMFAGLFEDGKTLPKLIRRTAALQDQLGAANDLVTALDLLQHLPTQDYATGIIAGWCHHGTIRDDGTLLRSWQKFRRCLK